MSLAYLGPIAVRIQNPEFHPTSSHDSAGTRSFSISGLMRWTSAQQALELVDNPGRSLTVGAHSGVLEYLHFSDVLLRSMSGWYLLQSFDLTGSHAYSVGGIDYPVPFSLSATYLGDNREPVIVRSTRARTNDFSLTPVAVASEAFWSVGAVDDAMAVSGFSTTLYREYDPRAYAASLPTLSPTGQKLCYLSDTSTPWRTIIPAPRVANASPPGWIVYRGGDCRSYDVTQAREVYGPSHPFAATSDLLLTNGLIRATLGNRGSAPSFAVSAFHSGAWASVGSLVLSGALMGVRIIRLTPDAMTVSLSIAGDGETHVTLRRGERGLRLVMGSDKTPSLSAARTITWASSSASASSGGRRVGAADANGFLKSLLMLKSGFSDAAGFGITSGTTPRFEVGAFLARAATNEAAADQHNQFAAATSQEVRVR